MFNVTFDPVISYGSIISTIAVAIGLVAGYAMVNMDTQAAQTAIDSYDRRVAFLEIERSKTSQDMIEQRIVLNSHLTGLEINMLTLLDTVQGLRYNLRETH